MRTTFHSYLRRACSMLGLPYRSVRDDDAGDGLTEHFLHNYDMGRSVFEAVARWRQESAA